MRIAPPSIVCPHCGHRLEHITAIGHTSAPRDGSIALCADCGAFSVFDKGELRFPNKEEDNIIATDATLLHLKKAWKFTKNYS